MAGFASLSILENTNALSSESQDSVAGSFSKAGAQRRLIGEGIQVQGRVDAGQRANVQVPGFGGGGGGAAAAGGPLSMLADALSKGKKLKDAVDGFDKISNLYEAFEGGHMDAAMDLFLETGDIGTLQRSYDLAATFGSPGNIGPGVGEGNLVGDGSSLFSGEGQFNANPGGIGSNLHSSFNPNFAFAGNAIGGLAAAPGLTALSTASVGFIPGGAASAASVFGTGGAIAGAPAFGTGLSVASGAAGAGTAGATGAGAAAGAASGAGMGAMATLGVVGLAVGAFVMLASAQDSSEPVMSKQKVGIKGGKFVLGTANRSKNGTAERPLFEADFLFELNALSDSGAIEMADISDEFELSAGQLGGYSKAEDFVKFFFENGLIKVNDSAAFSSTVGSWSGRRKEYLTNRAVEEQSKAFDAGGFGGGFEAEPGGGNAAALSTSIGIQIGYSEQGSFDQGKLSAALNAQKAERSELSNIIQQSNAGDHATGYISPQNRQRLIEAGMLPDPSKQQFPFEGGP